MDLQILTMEIDYKTTCKKMPRCCYRLRNCLQKYANALLFIQQAIYDNVFAQLMAKNTSKQAWSILPKEFQDNPKIIVVRLESLRYDVETFMMKSGEFIVEVLSRVVEILRKIWTYGENVTE